MKNNNIPILVILRELIILICGTWLMYHSYNSIIPEPLDFSGTNFIYKGMFVIGAFYDLVTIILLFMIYKKYKK